MSCSSAGKNHHVCQDSALLCTLVLQGCSSEALARTKTDYDSFLADPVNLKAVKEQLQVRQCSPSAA